MSGYICENCMAVDPKDGAFNGCLACQSLARSESGITQDQRAADASVPYTEGRPLVTTPAHPAAHPLPTPRTDREEYVTGKNDVGFRVVNPALCRTLEREAAELRSDIERHLGIISQNLAEIAELRAQLAEVKEALAGDDCASLPSDYPLVRMAHTIRADHDKFRNQVIDTCKRAEKAERQRDEALAAAFDEALQCYSPDDSATDWADKIRALKEKSNG
jgi:hypothetical protein